MRKLFIGVVMALFIICGVSANSQATVYLDGVSPLLSASPPGTFDLGSHLPGYIGGTVGSAANGTNLDGNRVYFYDTNSSTDNPQTATPFNLLVWMFSEPKDSVRLYSHQDHVMDGYVNTTFDAAEVLEYSVWGCNGGIGDCTTQAEWVFLSDPTSFVDATGANIVTYSFAGIAPATIYRGGSAENGLINAYTQDFNFGTAYTYYGIRGSTIAMLENTADPELDALVAFNKVDFPGPGGNIPEPSTLLLLGSGLLGLAGIRKRFIPK